MLLDAPLRESKAAYHIEVSIPVAPNDTSLRLRAAAEGSPAFRLHYA